MLSHRVPRPPLAHSLAENEIGDEGATKLAAILKETNITDLKCAAPAKRLFSCQQPVEMLALSVPPHSLIPCSLERNDIGDKGASALAAILQETQITNLKCAAPRAFAFVSMPIDTPTLSPSPILPLACSLRGSQIGNEGATALAAILKETQITDLECAAAPKCSFRVSAR